MSEILASALVYLGGILLLAVLLRRVLRKPWRPWLLLAVSATFAGFRRPTSESHVEPVSSNLDRFAPTYQFHEVHEIEIPRDPASVYKAVKETTAAEIVLFQTLVAIRRLGRPGPESILNPTAGKPLLDVATGSGFQWLTAEPGREVVVGTLVAAPAGGHGPKTPEEFASLSAPGYAKAALNFRIDEIHPGVCRLRTETRVLATGPAATRRFAAYWRVIYPGSSLIRHMWLRAIRARAVA